MIVVQKICGGKLTRESYLIKSSKVGCECERLSQRRNDNAQWKIHEHGANQIQAIMIRSWN